MNVRQMGLIVVLATMALPDRTVRAENGDMDVLEVIVTYQEYDARIPWYKKAARVRQGYGVMVGAGEVVTTEDLTRNHTMVELRRARTGEKIQARVQESDYQINLALLTFAETPATKALKPVTLAPPVHRGDHVQVILRNRTGEFQSGDGQVTEISLFGGGAVRSLAYRVLTTVTVEGNGTPVFADGKLVGISMLYDKGTQTCTLVPSGDIGRFLNGVRRQPYAGVGWAGFGWSMLLDPGKRTFLGLSDEDGGVLVTSTVPGSGAENVLKPEDVVLEWDGHRIDKQGYYDDAEFGRVLFSYLIFGKHQPGETVPVTYMRQKARQTATVTLKRYQDASALIPENVLGEQSEYLVDGGLVLRELTADYLKAGGPNWIVGSNPRLSYLVLNKSQGQEKPGEHIVILAGVLPDPINVGYQMMRDEIVEAVNGTPVSNMADVFTVVARDGGLYRLKLRTCGVELALDKSLLKAANQRVSQLYRLPALQYRGVKSTER